MNSYVGGREGLAGDVGGQEAISHMYVCKMSMVDVLVHYKPISMHDSRDHMHTRCCVCSVLMLTPTRVGTCRYVSKQLRSPLGIAVHRDFILILTFVRGIQRGKKEAYITYYNYCDLYKRSYAIREEDHLRLLLLFSEVLFFVCHILHPGIFDLFLKLKLANSTNTGGLKGSRKDSINKCYE